MSGPETATKPRRATALPPDERRSMIVEATLPLLLEHGDRVTSKQIAEAAGIAEGTVFRAFADKDELIVAVIESAIDTHPLERALATIPPGLGFESTRYHEMTRRPVSDSDALVRIFAAYPDEITVEPMAAARLLRALTLSTTHPMLADVPRSADELVQLFLHGVGKDAPC
jgi:AcrR family transcriptional regulator